MSFPFFKCGNSFCKVRGTLDSGKDLGLVLRWMDDLGLKLVSATYKT